jgi:hypothetical protein
LVADALEALRQIGADELEALAARPVALKLRQGELHFTAAKFLLSFSLPNFYFHAATAYDILRSKGVPLGKRDYIGEVQSQR